MLALIGTVLAGGATGLLGSVFSSAIGLFKDWRKEKADQAAFDREIQLLQMQSDIAIAESENEAKIAMEAAYTEMRKASYDHDSKVGRTSIWVNDILRMVRPSLTFILIILVGVIYLTEDAHRAEITHSVLYMMSSAVLWWFGDRALKNNQ